MTFPAFGAVANIFFSLSCGYLVWRSAKSASRRAFIAFCGSVALWSLFYYCWQTSRSATQALFFARALMAPAIFIPVFYLHHVMRLLGVYRARRPVLYVLYALDLIWLATLFTPHYISSVEPYTYYPYRPLAGPLYGPCLATFAFAVIYGVVLIFAHWRRSTGDMRHRLSWVLLGTVIGWSGGATNFPLWYKVDLIPYGNILVSGYVVCVAYAILRHQFMDIRLILRDTTLHGASAFLMAMGTLILCLPLVSLNAYVAVVTGVFVMGGLMAVAYDPVRKALQPAIDRMIFAGRFAYLEELGRLPNDMLEFTNLREMLKFLVTRLTEAARLERVRVLMYDPGHQSYVEMIFHSAEAANGGQAEPKAADDLSDNSALVQLLRENKQLLVEDHLSSSLTEKAVALVELKALGGAACFPVMKERDMLGLVVLGPKRSGEPFNQQDLKILLALRTRLENFLGQAMTITQEALNMVKDSHDMKNDVNALKGRVTWRAMRIADWKMVYEKQMQAIEDWLTAEKKKAAGPAHDQLTQAIESLKAKATEWFKEAERSRTIEDQAIQRLTHRLKNWAEYGRVVSEGFRGSRFMEAINVGEAAQMSVERWKPHAEKKNLQLAFETLPNLIVWGERSLIEQVIENLIDNAIKATQQGRVDVRCRSDREGVLIEVRDSGCGIPAEDLPTIFEKPFYQGRGRETLEQSTGVGLYLVSQYVRSLGGRVRAESQVGQGSAFFVHLPRYDQRKGAAA